MLLFGQRICELYSKPAHVFTKQSNGVTECIAVFILKSDCKFESLLFPISRALSTWRRRTDELGSRLERPIYFECKLNEPMHIGMQLLHPAATDHSVSISRQQVQCIFSFSLRGRAVTSFCSWLLLNEWIQWVEHALRKTLLLVVRHYSGGGSSHVKWTSLIRLHYPCLCCRWPSPLCASAR